MTANIAPLRPLVAEGRLTEVAGVIAAIGVRNPAQARYVTSRVPALLLNNDPRFEQSISFDNFIHWERKNPDWARSLERAVARPATFEAFVEHWLAELADFQRRIERRRKRPKP